MCAMSRWKGSRLVRLENRPKMSSRRAKSIPDIFLGWWDAPFPPLEPLDFAQNTLFLAISNGSRGEERYLIPSILFSMILFILLEDVSGWFSNKINLEPFHLDMHTSIGAFQAKNRGFHAHAHINCRTLFLAFFIFVGHT